jgi:radical SAM superfamily enzyme YgiQ (UPF0313 family)
VKKNNHQPNKSTPKKSREKILLALLPFWTPLITPLGISCLKSHLKMHGYPVTTIDANLEVEFKDLYQRYFDTLKTFLPDRKKIPGNYYYNIGNHVLRNHLMAYINAEEEKDSFQLVERLISTTYYHPVTEAQVYQLHRVLGEFYTRLETYFLELLEREQPDILGLSVYSDTLPASMFAFELTRRKYPGIMTVMGGSVFSNQLTVGTPNMNLFLEKTRPYIDRILVGEGEILFHKLLQHQLDEGKRVYTLKDINGEVLDLTRAELVDFSGINAQKYPYLSAYSSRSCPYQCSFCSETVNWGRFRKKPAQQVAAELKRLAHTHNTQLFFMGDSLLNPIISDLSLELLKSDTCVYWDGYLRADPPVTQVENTLLWRRGGFFRARLGVESGSQHVLDLMGKKITVAQIKDALSSLAHAGIKTSTYWVVGHPGETEEDFLQTLDLIKELKNDIYEAMCNPFNYYFSGQVNSGNWAAENKIRLLYPGKYRDLLVVQTWHLDCEPSREETYHRLMRFVQHCNKLEVPNPYSLLEISKAEERWKKRHKNAVPALLDFKDQKEFFDECRHAGEVLTAQNTIPVNDDFGF